MLRYRRGCCDKITCDYQQALLKTGAWPLEALGHRTALVVLLDRLGKFQYKVRPKRKTCDRCDRDYEKIVYDTAHKARVYFDGLCLDCMNASKPKTEDEHTDYWAHNKLKEYEFVKGCRVIKHVQPTWYFSFMGRREEQDRLRKLYREKPHAKHLGNHHGHLQESSASLGKEVAW